MEYKGPIDKLKNSINNNIKIQTFCYIENNIKIDFYIIDGTRIEFSLSEDYNSELSFSEDNIIIRTINVPINNEMLIGKAALEFNYWINDCVLNIEKLKLKLEDDLYKQIPSNILSTDNSIEGMSIPLIKMCSAMVECLKVL